jgi:hypothetical protein
VTVMRALANAGLGGVAVTLAVLAIGGAASSSPEFTISAPMIIIRKSSCFVRSIKSECLNRMILFGQASLQRAIAHFMAHYHTERNHQGLANQLLRPAPIIAPSQPVHRRQRLGGMLNYYHRAAA